ncbi:MAG: HAMP domain-containing histidine kinase [Austwickia sp.]|nr:HAMP domain-containing histidine kinase [Actinomycetota bacterium]MCB1252151.1 HAMP domain-containing histidine kinase [Austwickia sp.]
MSSMYLRTVGAHLLVAATAVVVAALFGRHLVLAMLTDLNEAPHDWPMSATVERIDRGLAAGAAVGLALSALVACVAAYRLVLPLSRLRHATATIGTGEYQEPLPAVDGSLGSLVTDLNRLRGALADTETRRRRLLGEVAHEMRTPLTIIDGYVEGMIDGIIPIDAEELGHVTDEVRRLRRLSDDLSALSRAEEGRLDLRPLLFDLRGVVVAAAERLRPQVEDAGLVLDVRPGAELVPVYVDQDRVSQVVRNLVGNAVRATTPGGTISLRIGRSGRWTWFSVRDTGEGIDPADLERIFERFYRVVGRRESRGETGSGIGLTIAREIIRAHGGELVARSSGRGLGAEFIGWLPAMI